MSTGEYRERGGIYALHLRTHRMYVLRTAEWRIVLEILTVELLTLKAALLRPGALSITVTNSSPPEINPAMIPTSSEQAAVVLKQVTGWNEPDIVKVLNGTLKAGAQPKNRRSDKAFREIKSPLRKGKALAEAAALLMLRESAMPSGTTAKKADSSSGGEEGRFSCP